MKRKKPKIKVTLRRRPKSPMERMLAAFGVGTGVQPTYPITIKDKDGKVVFHSEKCTVRQIQDPVLGTRHWSFTPMDPR